MKSILKSPRSIPLDIGLLRSLKEDSNDEISCRRFAVSSGLGFDAAVCAAAMQSKAKDALNHIGLGKLIYLGIALQQIFTSPKVSCDIYYDQEEPIHLPSFLFVVAMIHRYEGGGFMFCPKANYEDNLLDILQVGPLEKWRFLLLLPFALTGHHIGKRGIVYRRAHSMRIQSSIPLWVHTDGETKIPTSHICIECTGEKLILLQ